MALEDAMPKDDDPRCYFCSQEVTDDSYCYGCGYYVCTCCDHRDPGAMGSHPVEDHEGKDTDGKECPTP